MRGCKELTRMMASGELEDAGLMERMRVRLHLMICHNCRRYKRQLGSIAEAARQIGQELSQPGELQGVEARVLGRVSEELKQAPQSSAE
jgi:hypothetical protein